MPTKASFWTHALWIGVALAAAASTSAGCGASSPSETTHGTGGSGASGGKGTGTGAGGNNFGGDLFVGKKVVGVTLDPPLSLLDAPAGTAVSQQLTATAHYDDGSLETVTSGAVWTATAPQIGTIDGNGLYTATGALGGAVTVTIDAEGFNATAKIQVKVHAIGNSAMVPNDVQTSLQGATTQDPGIVWAYPYDGTVWPRGLLPPTLMWNGGAAADVYYVRLDSPGYEISDYVTAQSAPSSRVPLDPASWQQFTDSTAGTAKLTVARWDGGAATLVASHTWVIAPASMRGTIYYWSNDLGRVLRIKPGATTPDDFANQPPLNDPAQYAQTTCLMTCHTVSADGSTLISGGGVFGGSYDLKTNQPMFSLGGTWGLPQGSSSSVVRWGMPAVSPTGKYVLTNSMAQGLSIANDGTGGFLGLYTAADGQPVPSSGMMGMAFGQPAWSPDGKRVAYVDAGDPAPWAGSWNNPPPGDLKMFDFNEQQSPMISNQQTIVATGGDPNQRIAWPTITPDGQWVVYSRTSGADTRTGTADLYIASAVTPNQEARLGKVDGDGYPFAAGARDLSWNFEPSFAPVAAGGYFWVVFTSRRTYGNVLTGGKDAVKQLWVAAIDENAQPGTDPSHPAFHLTGQVESNLAMRGYWALEPCKGDGAGCATGTDCCGGFCGADGLCASSSGGCSKDGDKCQTNADCCNAGSGAKCINSVCSEPPPQ